jgi:hypothetical protein
MLDNFTLFLFVKQKSNWIIAIQITNKRQEKKCGLGLGLWCLTIFQQYFSISYISFIGGGNRSTHERGSNSQL